MQLLVLSKHPGQAFWRRAGDGTAPSLGIENGGTETTRKLLMARTVSPYVDRVLAQGSFVTVIALAQSYCLSHNYVRYPVQP